MSKRLEICAAVLLAAISPTAETLATNLTPDADVSIALEQNRDLAAARFAIRQAGGRLKQAGLWPNPEFELGGQRDRALANEGESKFLTGFKQRFPITGRLAKAKAVARLDVARRIVVAANVSGRDLGSVVAEIQRKLNENVHLPSGFFISYEGQFQSQQQATRLIGVFSIATLAAMFLVLYSHFRSTGIVVQILLNITLAFIGALVATYFVIGTVSVATLAGLICLAGIASRNTIMMIFHYLHLVRHEGEQFTERMIVRGSLERLVPVTMTALTAGLALIPLALAAGEPGKEILYPVAVVILGGLTSATLLDMAVTPAVFYKFGRKAAEQYIKREQTEPLDAIPALPALSSLGRPGRRVDEMAHAGSGDGKPR